MHCVYKIIIPVIVQTVRNINQQIHLFATRCYSSGRKEMVWRRHFHHLRYLLEQKLRLHCMAGRRSTMRAHNFARWSSSCTQAIGQQEGQPAGGSQASEPGPFQSQRTKSEDRREKHRQQASSLPRTCTFFWKRWRQRSSS